MVILGNLGNDVYYIAGAQSFQREVEEYVRNGKNIFLRGLKNIRD